MISLGALEPKMFSSVWAVRRVPLASRGKMALRASSFSKITNRVALAAGNPLVVGFIPGVNP